MAERRSRHMARRRRRLTPRRWPVLVVVPALLIGAAIVDRDHTEPTSREPDASSTTRVLASLQPTASSATALSSTFFCAGGSARGASGPAELSVVVANAADEAATGEVTVYGSNDRSAAKPVQVPPHGQVTVDTRSILEADWVAAQVEVIGGQVSVERQITGSDGIDTGPCSSSSAPQWTLPSGSTVRGSDEFLALFNPFADDATVDLRFVTDTGVRTPLALQGYQVPARSLRVVRVTSVVARRPIVTSIVQARTGQIVVDRIQLGDGTGDRVQSAQNGPTTAAPKGVTVTSGIPLPARTWSFADAANLQGARTRIVVYNPGRTEAEVDVHVDLDDPRRNGTLDPFELTIEPRDVQVLDLTAQSTIPHVGFSVSAQSVNGVPVYAELTYDGGSPAHVKGMAATPGAPTAATSWLFGAGANQGDTTEQISVLNPGASPATLTVERLRKSGRSKISDLTGIHVAAGARAQLELPTAGEGDLVLLVSADQPIVAQSTIARRPRGLSTAMGVPLPAGLVPAPAGP